MSCGEAKPLDQAVNTLLICQSCWLCPGCDKKEVSGSAVWLVVKMVSLNDMLFQCIHCGHTADHNSIYGDLRNAHQRRLAAAEEKAKEPPPPPPPPPALYLDISEAKAEKAFGLNPRHVGFVPGTFCVVRFPSDEERSQCVKPWMLRVRTMDTDLVDRQALKRPGFFATFTGGKYRYYYFSAQSPEVLEDTENPNKPVSLATGRGTKIVSPSTKQSWGLFTIKSPTGRVGSSGGGSGQTAPTSNPLDPDIDKLKPGLP
jgi:hypothetical protein